MSENPSTPPGDALFATPESDILAAQPGDLITGSRDADPTTPDADKTDIPEQEEFYRSPARFGSVPVDDFPLGWDRRLKFNKVYPYVSLPTQIVERVSFGHAELPPNRLIWGDNLHAMRQLPSESLDLIYIDPPFFSGRQYNVIFGDQNEVRSFSDIWDAGLPGYLEWLNARLFEMKRLLKPTGSIYVHLDWHAVHYVKQELDGIFGYGNFLNDIAWLYGLGGSSNRYWPRKHDSILWYSKAKNGQYFEADRIPATSNRMAGQLKKAPDYWDIPSINNQAKERLGYPTQKPEALLERLIRSSCPEDGYVADFFVGGGTTAAVAQRLGRKWIACDQSRVAVAVTANRLATLGEKSMLGEKIPDFTLEHWGTYEAARLSQAPPDQFQRFIIDAARLRQESDSPQIHAFRGQLPVWIGPPSRDHRVTAQEVLDFANAVRQLDTFRQGMLREARMIAWAFSPGAQEQATSISDAKHSSNNYLDIELVRIESDAFREHIIRLSSDKADYSTFLTFVRPPEIVVGMRHLEARTWRFDVGDTLVTNTDAKLINVQWDFDYRDERFTSSLSYKELRHATGLPKIVVDWSFPNSGPYAIACKVQDDMGGEGFYTGTLLVK
jgi:DNA modification methylase